MIEAKPLSKIVYDQFIEHRLAVVGFFVVLTFSLIAIFAPVISMVSGISPDDQNVFNRYKPPMTRLSLPLDQRETAVERYIEAFESESLAFQNRLILLPEFSGIALDDVIYELANKETSELQKLANRAQAPESFLKLIGSFETLHILGTDELGRDVFIRLVYGTRVSLGVGVLVALASSLIGLLVGCLAGYYGGWLDTVLMRITDGLLSLPLLPVLIVFAAIDFSKAPLLKYIITPENQAVMKLVVVLCLFSWMWVGRLVRGSILTLKEREFILAAKTLGAHDTTIMLRHIVPNVVAPLLVAVTLGVGESILFEAALSFLGLGIQPPTPSWGNMLNNAQELIYEAPLLAIIPGVLILMTTISFNYIGDGLQDAIDPKAIRR